MVTVSRLGGREQPGRDVAAGHIASAGGRQDQHALRSGVGAVIRSGLLRGIGFHGNRSNARWYSVRSGVIVDSSSTARLPLQVSRTLRMP